MHKLVILIEPISDWPAFHAAWPEFLRYTESMPGLRREASGQVEKYLFGVTHYVRIHELYFDSLEDGLQALSSPQGKDAGRLLQRITGGRIALFFTDHLEDEIANIQRYREDSTS